MRNYERRFWELAIERNDSRTFSTQVQNDLAQQLAEAERLRAAAAAADAARAAMAGELGAARDRIFHMERSIFWRLRALFRR